MNREEVENDERAEDPELVRLISIALEMREEGIQPPIEEICGERPDLVAAVTAAVGRVGQLNDLHRASGQFDPHLNRTLGDRYQLVARIGAGSMGVVYEGKDLELGRSVAVKVMRSDVLAGEEAERRFLREAEVLAAVHHPSVVTVFDRGRTEDGLMFLVMELLEGQPLADAIETSDLRQSVRWIAELAQGVQAAHEQGVFHRDIKPSNVFIRQNGQAVVLDFGIAARHAEATIAHRDNALGTPAYMAPERLDQDRESTAAVDVYGLTATLYHLVTNHAPYSGSPTQIIAKLQSKDPRPAFRLRAGLPTDLQAILDKGMARDANARYSTAAECETDLRSFLAYEPVTARPITAVGRVWRRVRRTREFKILSALLAIAIAALVTIAIYEHRLAARLEAWLVNWSKYPPTRAFGPATTREISDPKLRSDVASLLDSLVAGSDDALPSRLVRALFRLDHGDPVGAREDMAVVAGSVGTRYAVELAKLYEGLPESASGAAAIDLSALPTPSTPHDCYLAAIHLVRTSKRSTEIARQALDLLQHEGLAGLHHAHELAAQLRGELTVLAKADERLEQHRLAHSEAIRIEFGIGRRTAATALALGRALSGQERHVEAIAMLRGGLELAPSDAGLMINLGVALNDIGAMTEARKQFESSVALAPGSPAAHRGLIITLLQNLNFDLADEAIANAPFSDRDRARMQGKAHFNRAMYHSGRGNQDAAIVESKLAIQHLEAALGERATRNIEHRVCVAIATGEPKRIFALLAASLSKNPMNWRRIHLLALLMPEHLEAYETALLRKYLQSLHQHLAPHQPSINR